MVANLKFQANSMDSTITRLDFAYPRTDARFYCLPVQIPSVKSPFDFEQEPDDVKPGDHVMDWLDVSTIDDSTSSLGSELSLSDVPQLRNAPVIEVDILNLLRNLNIAQMLQDKMRAMDFHIYKAKALYDFQAATEWEMAIREGTELLIVERASTNAAANSTNPTPSSTNPSPSSNNPLATPASTTSTTSTTSTGSTTSCTSTTASTTSTASTDSKDAETNPKPSIYVRPKSMPVDLDRFLTSAVIYPEGWVLGVLVKVKIKGRIKTNAIGLPPSGISRVKVHSDGSIRVRIKLVDRGLVPLSYIERIE